MKNWNPIVLTVGILALLWLFVPRLLDIVEKATKPPTTDDLVNAIQVANAKAAKQAADDKAAADAAAKK
jgi:Tfp pilus assembly protein FimT